MNTSLRFSALVQTGTTFLTSCLHRTSKTISVLKGKNFLVQKQAGFFKKSSVVMEGKIKHDLVLAFTLKAPITIAADDIYKYFFIVFQRK